MYTWKIVALIAVLTVALIAAVIHQGSDGLARGGVVADRIPNSHQQIQRTSPVCQPGRPSRESRFCQEDRHRTLGAVPYDRLVGDLGLGRLAHCPLGGTDSGFRANSSCHFRPPQAQVRRKINKTLVSSSATVRCQSAPSLDRLLSDTRPSHRSRTSTLIH